MSLVFPGPISVVRFFVPFQVSGVGVGLLDIFLYQVICGRSHALGLRPILRLYLGTGHVGRHRMINIS